MAVVAVSLLYGCVGERHQMTPEEQKAFLADQNAQHTAELKSVEAQAKAQGLTVGQLQEQQEQQALNAELERSQAKHDKQADNERLERLCEAMHPYMISQCMINSGINQMVDSL